MSVREAILPTVLLVSCLAVYGASRPATVAGETDSLYVYLNPLAADAVRLSFDVQTLHAVREDGAEVPLALSLRQVDGDTLDRERRLASAPLRPGRYVGLSLATENAQLEGKEGTAELLVPEQPVRVTVPFTVGKRQAVVLKLRLDYGNSVDDGFRFVPRFAAEVAPLPPAALLGIASIPGPGAVMLFDKVSGSVVGVIPVGREPGGMALDSRRRRAYVAVAGEDAVVAIGFPEHAVLGRARMRGGDRPEEVALTPDGDVLLTANAGSRTVSFVDALSLVETARVEVGDEPRSIVIDRAGRRAYVLNTGAASVTVLDIAGRAAVATIATEAEPFRAQLDRAGDALYVVHRRSFYLTVIDPAELSVRTRVNIGPGATALKVDGQTGLIYLSRRNTKTVEVYDPLSLLPADSIATEDDASFLAIDGENNILYAALPRLREIRGYRIVGKGSTARADVGERPTWVVLFGER